MDKYYFFLKIVLCFDLPRAELTFNGGREVSNFSLWFQGKCVEKVYLENCNQTPFQKAMQPKVKHFHSHSSVSLIQEEGRDTPTKRSILAYEI